jgi:hypothetical protein
MEGLFPILLSQVLIWLGVFVILVRVVQKSSAIQGQVEAIKRGAREEVKPRVQGKA